MIVMFIYFLSAQERKMLKYLDIYIYIYILATSNIKQTIIMAENNSNSNSNAGVIGGIVAGVIAVATVAIKAIADMK